MNLRRALLAFSTALLLSSALPIFAQAPAGPPALDEARKAFAAGDFATAAAAYEKVSAAQPQNPMLKMRLGQCYARLGKWAEAATAFDQAASGGAPTPLFTVDHVAAYAQQGKTAEALALLEKAIGGGFGQAKALETSGDLANLRSNPAFQALVTAADKNARPCHYDDNARAFDFWAGDWTVLSQGGQAGTSHVEVILEGCVVFENWTASGGGTGKSFNFWDKNRKRWQQTWIDSRGNLLEFHGQFTEPGKLVYDNEVPGPGGKTIKNRLSFTKLGPDQVRQLWEQSTDGGATWSVVFDGDYQRKK
jgi:tetratricopeptide (TPR) repeat protein